MGCLGSTVQDERDALLSRGRADLSDFLYLRARCQLVDRFSDMYLKFINVYAVGNEMTR